MKKKWLRTRRAVCIISGGLDSSGVAAFWKSKGYSLNLLTFDYGQRAKKEISRAKEIGRFLGVESHKFVDISFMKDLYGSTNVLTDSSKKIPSHFQSNIIVPIRNAIFLTIATANAFSIGAEILAYGAHLTDQPYPDCRPDFARSLERTLNLGDADAIKLKKHPPIELWSPAIAGQKKEELLKISHELMGDHVFRTWSCYLNGKYQCGMCESCRNRKIAFKSIGIYDKTEYS
ncbi:MAG: 7-cyano-7-deazaguanine synthase QueC [Nitrososphaerota archaeon]|nr:7-cyano-7-deazaguanine synthase QueC [Nitrososphaerota archaeon]